MKKPLLLLVIFHFVIDVAFGLHGNYASQRLVKDILDPKKYDKKVRPLRNHTLPVTITLRINLYQILDINEPNQNVELYVWLTQVWKDEFLGWDPKEYEGISTYVIPFDEVWRPDTYLYNNLEMQREASERWSTVVVTTEGSGLSSSVRFMYPAIFRFTCKMQIRFFPFDTQVCTMVFGSWTSDNTGINYEPESDKVLQEGFIENEEWTVLSLKIERQEVKYQCCPNKWVFLFAHLEIQRKPLFYLVNLVIPTAVICLVAVVGFFTPASTSGDRTEKVNLGITTLLAMAILLLMVSDSMPTTSNFIPLIGLFFLIIIILISVGTVATSIIICIQQQGRYGKPVPNWIRKLVFEKIASIIRCQPNMHLAHYWRTKGIVNSNNVKKANHTMETLLTNRQVSRGEEMLKVLDHSLEDEVSTDYTIKGSAFPEPPPPFLLEHISEVTEESDDDKTKRSTTTLQQDGFEIEGIRYEWEYLADILDRICLISFTLALLGVSMAMLVVGFYSQSQH